jgi:hypothetical protein
MGWSPVQGFLPTVNRIKKLKKKNGQVHKSCRAIYRQIHTDIHRWVGGYVDR